MTQLICGILRLDEGQLDSTRDKALVGHMAASMIANGLGHEMRIASSGPVTMAAIRLRGYNQGSIGTALVEPDLIETNDTLLVSDITIYDRARLRHPVQAIGLSDGAFLQAALAECGISALCDLHGDFAFAEWRDGRLTLGRDHFGARPIVYTEAPGCYFAFASSPAALLRTGLASPALDEPVVASWMLNPTPPPGRTIYQDIRPVDAAHVVDCTLGADASVVTTRRYWRLDITRRMPFDSDPRKLAAETERLLTQAVVRRLPAAGPGAGHLSGGLDSSPIAVIAARSLSTQGRSFYGYTFREPEHGPGAPGTGDAPMADLVAATEPEITQVAVISPSLLATYAEGVEPETLLPISAAEPEEQVLRDAAMRGAAVMLSGWGGDQIVSYHGRGAEVELLRSGRLIRLWRHLSDEVRETGIGFARLFISTALVQALPHKIREAVRSFAGRGAPLMSVTASRSRLVASHRRRTLLIERSVDAGDTHEIRRKKAEAWYLQTRLEAFARQGARHAIAYAYPLLDLDLVEYSMQIPGIFLRSGGRRRLVLRKALAGILPDPVRYGPTKLLPFPGEDQRNAAERERLLALLRQWGNIARIGDFLDLQFMAEVICSLADPDAPADHEDVDLTPAFQIAVLLGALEDDPFDGASPTEMPQKVPPMNIAAVSEVGG